MNEYIISIHQLSKSFGSLEVIRNLDLDISPGIFGLIGPNGAGKTTLFRTLLNLIRPDGGKATILGYDIEEESLAIRRKVGVLHERPTYPPFLTPLEYLDRMGKLFKERRNPEELLELV
ncbi:MAG: ATP-binding cassette domain-containing protein, partial [Candidatus Lokiarchaeota archaeon]|nr:ATP-binding cassette domain-containing protein [Candidatus Lokiarchaeota archaeon]